MTDCQRLMKYTKNGLIFGLWDHFVTSIAVF